METLQARARALRQRAEACATVREQVGAMTERPWHEVMAPFGDVAWVKARLVDCNAMMVLLGDGYFVEKTAKGTQEVLLRREEKLRKMLKQVEDVLEETEGIVEIRETLEEAGLAVEEEVKEVVEEKVEERDDDEFDEFWQAIPEDNRVQQAAKSSSSSSSQLHGFFQKKAESSSAPKNQRDVIAPLQQVQPSRGSSSSNRPVSRFKASRSKQS